MEIGIDKENELDGSKVYGEYKAGNHQKIADYCLRDVEMTKAIYQRLAS